MCGGLQRRKTKAKRCKYKRKKEVNEQFGRKMNMDVEENFFLELIVV